MTSSPGTLLSFVNGHINQGGEMEKRKAFVVKANVNGTFGAEPGADTIFVFGSGTTPGGLPAGITYVRCQHPDGTTAMTSILSSCTFAGLPFCVAIFNDNAQLCFYNGALVQDFVSGVVLAYLNTNTKIGTNAAALFQANAPTYTSTDHVNGSLDVFNKPANGSQYSVTLSKTSATGTFVDVLQANVIPATTETIPIGTFQIMSGTASPGNNKITSVKVNGVEVLTTAVNWTTSNEATAALVAIQINTTVSVPEYIASASGNLVTISAATGVGAGANGYEVKVVAAGNVCIGDCVFSFSLSSSGTTFNITHIYVDGVDILSTTITWTTDISTTVALAVTDINTNNATYLAYSSGGAMRISKRTTSSLDSSQQVVINVSTGGGVGPGTSNALVVELNQYTAAAVISPTSGRLFNEVINNIKATIFGGVPPYSLQWVRTALTQTFALNPGVDNTASYSPVFSALRQTGVTIQSSQLTKQTIATFVLNVTDNANTIASSQPLNLTFFE